MLLNGKHRHKLIDGLVIAMGRPGASPPRRAPMRMDDADSGDDVGRSEEGSQEEERAEPDDEKHQEAMFAARDLARALGIDDLDDDQAMAVHQAIKTMAEY